MFQVCKLEIIYFGIINIKSILRFGTKNSVCILHFETNIIKSILCFETIDYLSVTLGGFADSDYRAREVGEAFRLLQKGH
jgi:hypothetical protein